MLTLIPQFQLVMFRQTPLKDGKCSETRLSSVATLWISTERHVFHNAYKNGAIKVCLCTTTMNSCDSWLEPGLGVCY